MKRVTTKIPFVIKSRFYSSKGTTSKDPSSSSISSTKSTSSNVASSSAGASAGAGSIKFLHQSFPSRSVVTRQIWGNRLKNMVFQETPSIVNDVPKDKNNQNNNRSSMSVSSGSSFSIGGDSRLPPKRMSDSYCQVELPFGSNAMLREEYINVFGGLRYGKLLEDLDALAGSIAYSHCDHAKKEEPSSKSEDKDKHMETETDTEITDKDEHKQPWIIVTASMDRMDWLSHLKSTDNVRMTGRVTFVGKSSMEVTIRVDKQREKTGYKLVAVAKFTMVARDPSTNKSVQVYPLLIQSKEEKLLYQLALEYRHRKSLESEMSLERQPPTSEESAFLHKLFLLSMRDPIPNANTNPSTNPNNGIVYMSDTVMSSCHYCQPQERNIHQFMFGGTLMRKSFELAVATATLFVQGRRHALVAIDEFHFKKSVPLGSILRFTSMVVHTGPEIASRTFQIRVVADVLDPGVQGGKSFINTNVFYLTFEVLRGNGGNGTATDHGESFRGLGPVSDDGSGERVLPLLVPRTYGEAMIFLEAKRRRDRGILLSRRHSMDLYYYNDEEHDGDDDGTTGN